METVTKNFITVEATIKASIDKVWKFWTEPKYIMQWCNASDDWHVPHTENDLRVGGRFKTTMAAKDGSVSFDFSGVYTQVEPNKSITYTIDDGRTVQITFSSQGNNTKVIESFEAESVNPLEMQKGGWQAILDNFKKHTEAN